MSEFDKLNTYLNKFNSETAIETLNFPFFQVQATTFFLHHTLQQFHLFACLFHSPIHSDPFSPVPSRRISRDSRTVPVCDRPRVSSRGTEWTTDTPQACRESKLDSRHAQSSADQNRVTQQVRDVKGIPLCSLISVDGAVADGDIPGTALIYPLARMFDAAQE